MSFKSECWIVVLIEPRWVVESIYKGLFLWLGIVSFKRRILQTHKDHKLDQETCESSGILENVSNRYSLHFQTNKWMHLGRLPSFYHLPTKVINSRITEFCIPFAQSHKLKKEKLQSSTKKTQWKTNNEIKLEKFSIENLLKYLILRFVLISSLVLFFL